MTIQDIGIWIGGAILSLGALAFGFGYLISQFKDGRNKKGVDQLNSENALLEYLKTQNAGYAQALDEQNKKIADQNVVIGKMQTAIDERDKQLTEYKAIFTGTDSATKHFQEVLLVNINDQKEYREKSLSMLTQLLEGQSNAKDKAALPINIQAQLTQS
jgi:hypothetical protein